MAKKNDKMDEILNLAKSDATDRSYEEAEKEEKPGKAVSDKEKGRPGRKKVDPRDKKKARQVFYSDAEFEEIEALADELGIEPKAFMQMAINQKIKELSKDGE